MFETHCVYVVKHNGFHAVSIFIIFIIGEPFMQPVPIESTAVNVTAINCAGQRATLQVTFHVQPTY